MFNHITLNYIIYNDYLFDINKQRKITLLTISIIPIPKTGLLPNALWSFLICSQFLFRASTPKEDCKILYTLTLHNRFWPHPAVRTSTLRGHGINNFEGFMVFLIMQSDSVEVMKMSNIKNINSIRPLLPSHRDKPLHLVIWNLQSWLRA